MVELSKQYPNSEISVDYADEDIGSNCGSYVLKNGELINKSCGDDDLHLKFGVIVKKIKKNFMKIIGRKINMKKENFELEKLEYEEVEELFDEEYEDNDDNEEDYEPLATLVGVGVKDTENGLKIMLVGTDDNVLGEYELAVNISGYKEMELFNVCYEISKDIKDLYYSVGRIPTQEEVLNVVREVMVK